MIYLLPAPSWQHSRDALGFYRDLLSGAYTVSPADREFCELMLRSHTEYLANNAPATVDKGYKESLARMAQRDEPDESSVAEKPSRSTSGRRRFLGGLGVMTAAGAALGTGYVAGRLTSPGAVASGPIAAHEAPKTVLEINQKRMEELRKKHPELFAMSVQAHEKLDDRLADQVDRILLTFLDQPPAEEYRNAAGQMVRVDQYDKNPDGAPGKRIVSMLRFTPGKWSPDVYMDTQADVVGEIIWNQVAYTLDGNQNLTSASDRNTELFPPDTLKQMYEASCKLPLRGDVWWNDRIKQGLQGRGYDKPSRIYDTCNGSPNGWIEVIQTKIPN